MTSAVFRGYYYWLDASNNVQFKNAELNLTGADYDFDWSYTIPEYRGAISKIELDISSFYAAIAQTYDKTKTAELSEETLYLGRYGWRDGLTDKNTDILDIELSNSTGFVFALHGDDLPDLEVYGQAWLANVTSYNLVPDGPAQPNNETPISAFSEAETTENDTLIGTIDEDLYLLGNGDDRAAGDRGADRLYGGKGEDVLHGHQGDDHLFGGDGNDRLRGGSGNDIIDGRKGDDILRGGRGADEFFFAQGDTTRLDRIKDFNPSEDQLIFKDGMLGEMSIQSHVKGSVVSVGDVRVLLVDVMDIDRSDLDFIFA